MKDLDTKNAAVLWENGVKISLCTDHTVIPIQYLPLSAAIAVKAGLPYNAALRAITGDAADILNISDRVGRIVVGMDADLQLYSGDPLGLDDPDLVMIKGKIVE
jgi:imidazolonepropionase-like amidohydrolase